MSVKHEICLFSQRSHSVSKELRKNFKRTLFETLSKLLNYLNFSLSKAHLLSKFVYFNFMVFLDVSFSISKIFYVPFGSIILSPFSRLRFFVLLNNCLAKGETMANISLVDICRKKRGRAQIASINSKKLEQNEKLLLKGAGLNLIITSPPPLRDFVVTDFFLFVPFRSTRRSCKCLQIYHLLYLYLLRDWQNSTLTTHYIIRNMIKRFANIIKL